MRVKRLLLLLLVSVLLFIVLDPKTLEVDSDTANNGLTKADITEVYNNLIRFTGAPGDIPPLEILDNDVINAWINPTNLTVTTGMLHFVKNKDELAAVIGHEMGHFMLQHFDLPGDSRIHEANADKFGVYLMLRAGYNVCEAQGIWKRFDDRFGDPIITSSHPSPAQRAWELNFPICGQ